MISDEGAVHLAREAVAGAVQLPDDARAEVHREDGTVVVVFPTDLPPGVRGPDYHARVTLDAVTGEVIDILGGS